MSLDMSPPAWVISMKKLWSEDECLLNDPTAEHEREAWKRLFGEDMPAVPPHGETYDGGDEMVLRYSETRAISWSPWGTTIYSIPPAT